MLKSPKTRHPTTSHNCSAHSMLLNFSETVYAQSQNYWLGKILQQETHIPLCCTAGSVRSAVHSLFEPVTCATSHCTGTHPLQTAVVSVSADQLNCLQMWSFSSKRDDSNKSKLYPWQKFRAHECFSSEPSCLPKLHLKYDFICSFEFVILGARSKVLMHTARHKK